MMRGGVKYSPFFYKNRTGPPEFFWADGARFPFTPAAGAGKVDTGVGLRKGIM
jgi:hypothetical protein